MTISFGNQSSAPQKVIPPLWGHQQEAVRRAIPRDSFALFFPAGVGKTPTAVSIIRQWWGQDKRMSFTLVLCPPIVIENWRREWLKWSHLPKGNIIPLVGSGKERLAALQKAPQPCVVVTNYETLLMEEIYLMLVKRMASDSKSVMVCDESHRCKDFKSRRTKLSINLSDHACRRLILTGTPVLNTPMDIFTQYRILDRGQTFGTNFFVFRQTYFHDKNAFMPKTRYFPNWVLRPSAADEIAKAIQASSMTVKKEECIDLPPLVKKTIFVALSPEQRRAYEAMKKDFIAFIGDKVCTTAIALTKGLRMQQIVSGHLPVTGDTPSDETITHFANTPRQAAVLELLEEVAPYHKVIVWAVFKADYAVLRAVCDKLELPYVEIHGDVSPAKKQENVDLFNTDPKVRVLIGHPGSGGIGINLIASDYSIVFSRNFSLEQKLQSEARNYRAGSNIHESVTQIEIVAEGTIDEVVMDALNSKESIAEKITSWKNSI